MLKMHHFVTCISMKFATTNSSYLIELTESFLLMYGHLNVGIKG